MTKYSQLLLLAGAKSHAKEVLQVFIDGKNSPSKLCFFDDISTNIEDSLYNKFPILRSIEAARNHFKKSPNFVLALGIPRLRKLLSDKLAAEGGYLTSIIASSAYIGQYNVELETGLNLMHAVMVSNDVKIGKGTLINAFASIHHDVRIGEYCEVSPHATLLGGCEIGNLTAIGANATILPEIRIGKNVQIGAGAVVNKNIPDNSLAVGVPAKIIKTYG